MDNAPASLLDDIVIRTFVEEATYIRRCALHGNDFFHRLLFRTHAEVNQQMACDALEEIKQVCGDFYLVSSDSEIQMRKIVSDVSAIFVLRPSLMIAWLASDEQEAFARLLHMSYYNKHPSIDFFRCAMDVRARRTAWSFAAVVSHGVREHLKDSSICKKLPLYWRVVKWMEKNVSDWRTTLPGVLLVDEIIRAIRYRLSRPLRET